MKFNSQGQEMPDDTPIEVPAHLRGAESTDDRIQRLIGHAMSRYAMENGHESIEEANDFDIEDDDPDDVFTQHEVMSMALEVPPDGEGRDATHDAGHRARILNERIRRAQGRSADLRKSGAPDLKGADPRGDGGQPGARRREPQDREGGSSRAGRDDPRD